MHRLGARHFSRNLPHYQTSPRPLSSPLQARQLQRLAGGTGFAHYDLIMNIDPDHVPASTFCEVLGYFDDPTIGYVQAAQAYYNQAASFIARGAAEETYAYYSVTQMASYALGFPIVTGLHHHRAAASTGGRVRGARRRRPAPHLPLPGGGLAGVYVPKILARGLTPVDWAGYLRQQRRWARSVLDIKFRLYPRLAGACRAASESWASHGLYYLQGLTTGIGIGLLASMLASRVVPQFLTDGTLWRLAVLWAALQLGELYQQRFFLGGWDERGLHWRAGLLQLAKWPYLGLALLDVLRRIGRL